MPVHHNDLKLLEFAGEKYKIATCTERGCIQLYDSTHGGRPSKVMKVTDSPLKRIRCVLGSATQFLVSDTIGNVFFYDISSLKLLGTFKGSHGAIRDFQCFKSAG